jgi:uncharacterized SAM-binding protein YcdF (DUF218 family)
VNDMMMAMGLESWKSVVGTLLLPPVPFLVLVLVGARLMFRRRLLAWSLILLAVVGIWMTSVPALGVLMRQGMHPVPPALTEADIANLRKAGEASGTAIVVLGGGSRELSPEYGVSNLTPISIERLRYGIWLSRETRLPLAFSGGLGHGTRNGARSEASEAEIAARIAEREFGRPLRWTEDRSRDTAENGLLTMQMLHAAGVRRIVLVTHDYHMRRAVRAFEHGAQHAGAKIGIVTAPMGMRPAYEWEWADFMPSRTGFFDNHVMLHEWLGYVFGA